MHSFKSLFRLIEIGIVVVAIALAYTYRDALREAYENAKGYVQHANERLGIEGSESGTKAPAVSPPPAPVAGKPEQRPQPAVVAEARPQAQVQREIQPQMPPGSTPSTQPPAPPTGTTSSQPAPAPAATNATAPQAKTETAPVPAATPAEPASTPEIQAPAASPRANEQAAAPPVAPAETPAVPPAASQHAPAASPVPAQPVPAAPAVAPKAGESAAPSLSGMLTHARALAKSGRNAEAADAYRGIVQRYPDSYAAFGELGNIYYAQGKRQDAASSYYQAALRLLQAGHLQEAERLAGTVRSLDPILGGSLQTKITLARMRRH